MINSKLEERLLNRNRPIVVRANCGSRLWRTFVHLSPQVVRRIAMGIRVALYEPRTPQAGARS